MTSSTQMSTAEISRINPALPTGVDCGAGLLKMVVGSGEKQLKVPRHPSKVLEVRGDDLYDSLNAQDGGHFYYHAGARADLQSKEFLTGSAAQSKAPTSHLKLSDDPILKVQYSLYMILGALSSLPHQPEWNLHLAVSIHDAKLFGKQMVEKIQGVHIISSGSKNNSRFRVNLNVSLVPPEGAGAYGYCVSTKPPLIDKMGRTIAFDFGTSTVITSVFGAVDGKIVERNVLEIGGVIDLLDAIASDQALMEALKTGKPGNVEIIRQGIENKSFQYGSLRPVNFHSIYNRHIKKWFDDRFRLALKSVQEHYDDAQSFVAWGGGVALPGMNEMLQHHGISPVVDGCWANAIGLQRIAEARLTRGK